MTSRFSKSHARSMSNLKVRSPLLKGLHVETIYEIDFGGHKNS